MYPPIMLVEGYMYRFFFLFVFVLVSCKLRNQGDTKRKQNVSERMRDPRMGRPQDEIEVTAWYKGIQTTQVYLNLAISRIISLFFASSCDISSRCARDASNDARFASDGALPCNQRTRGCAWKDDQQREISEARYASNGAYLPFDLPGTFWMLYEAVNEAVAKLLILVPVSGEHVFFFAKLAQLAVAAFANYINALERTEMNIVLAF